jgi:hypothetical protein
LAGTSSIVWVAGVVGVAALGVVELVIWIPHRKSPRARFVLPLSGLALSLILSAPYFHLMAGSDLSVAPVIRITPTRQGLIYGSVFGHFFGPRWWTYVLDFPFQMVPEFGLVLLTGAAGLWCARQQWTRHYEIRQCALMVVVCFLLVLVVREGRNVNDYAPRIAGVAWTLLGVASGFWWMARRRHALWRRRLLRGLLLIFLVSGLATTLYEPLMVQTSSARVGVEHHELFEWLNTHTGRQDVFLLDHQTPGEVMLFVQRRTALSYKDLSTIYSSRLSLYGEAVQTIEKAYVESDPALAARDFQAVEVDYLVLSWRSALACESNALFTAYFIPVFQNRLYRVFWVNVSP